MEFYVDPAAADSIGRILLCDVHAVSWLWDDAASRPLVPLDVTAVSHSLVVDASLSCGLSCCPDPLSCGMSDNIRDEECRNVHCHPVWHVAHFPTRGMSLFSALGSALKSVSCE
jgi:hypothetical protein